MCNNEALWRGKRKREYRMQLGKQFRLFSAGAAGVLRYYLRKVSPFGEGNRRYGVRFPVLNIVQGE